MKSLVATIVLVFGLMAGCEKPADACPYQVQAQVGCVQQFSAPVYASPTLSYVAPVQMQAVAVQQYVQPVQQVQVAAVQSYAIQAYTAPVYSQQVVAPVVARAKLGIRGRAAIRQQTRAAVRASVRAPVVVQPLVVGY